MVAIRVKADDIKTAPPPTTQSDRANYLSFLFPDRQQQSQTSAPGTPVKVNKVAQPPIPHNPTTVSHQQQGYDEDVHMMTMRGTVDPRMLKGMPPVGGAMRYNPSMDRVQEDVHMKTVAREVPPAPKERMMQAWERELLDKAETKRKATVAQTYFLDYYCELVILFRLETS